MVALVATSNNVDRLRFRDATACLSLAMRRRQRGGDVGFAVLRHLAQSSSLLSRPMNIAAREHR